MKSLVFVVAGVAIAAGGYLLLTLTASSSDSFRLATPCTNEATAEAVRAGSDISAGRIISPDSEVECRARRALLEPEDIGSEWRYSETMSIGSPLENASPVYVGNGGYACGVPLVGARGGIERAFETGDSERAGLNLIVQSVVLFEAAAASDYLDAVRTSCDKRTKENPGAERPLEVRAAGDEVVAFELEEFNSVNYMALVRRGDAVVTLYYISDDPKFETLDHSVKVADQQLRKVESTLGAPDDPDYYIPPTPQPGTVEEVLASGLLTLEDFDSGWVKRSRRHVEGGRFCDEPLIPEGSRPRQLAKVAANFLSRREAVGQSAWLYMDGDATAEMALIRQSVASEPNCVLTYTFDLEEQGGELEVSYDVEIRPLEIASLGDEHVALRVRLDIHDGDRQEVSDFVYLRRGDAIIAVAFHHPVLVPPSSGRYDPPTDEIERLGELVDLKSTQLQDALSAFEVGD